MVDQATATCEHRLWRHGTERHCQHVALRKWVDETGRIHAGCPYHYRELVYRFPRVDGPTDRDVIEAIQQGDINERALHDEHERPVDGCRLCEVEMANSYWAAVGRRVAPETDAEKAAARG